MKSRDITEDEINKITTECKIREKAFFTIMRQSGLPPHKIKQLKIKNLEKILDPNTPIPCKIEVPNEKFPIFIGEEAVQYLQQYLERRAKKEKLTPASLLFTTRNNPNKEINTKDVSRAFARAAQKLKKQRKIIYKTESGKPSELRLLSLIRFYKKKAKDYLTELHNNNTSKNNESCRKLYEKKVMSYLEIEPPTPIQWSKLKKQQQKLENKLEEIENIILPRKIEFEVSPEFLKEYEEEIKEYVERTKEDEEEIKWQQEHPEEAKQREEKIKNQMKEWNERAQKYLEEHPEIAEQEQKRYIEHLETRINELEARLNEHETRVKKITETIQNKKP